MEMVTLGKTGITVPKNAFGALPIQRVGEETAIYILEKAYQEGIRFFDTARAYSDSEEKLGKTFNGKREEIYIASKTMAKDVTSFWKDLETSLTMLKTDYIDIYQFHNPDFCPKPGDGSGLYEAMLEAKEKGKIRHIGFTNHKYTLAKEAILSGLYETIQFPFSYIASKPELEIVSLCKTHNLGFIAMKALAGGLIDNPQAAYAYMAQFDHVLPIWGIQKESELDNFLSFHESPPALTPALETYIEKEKKQLSDNFCRGCGCCMPCPVGIEIHTCARISLLLRRAPSKGWLSEEKQEMMRKIEDCIHCGACSEQCPYDLDTPTLLEENYKDYKKVVTGEIKV